MNSTEMNSRQNSKLKKKRKNRVKKNKRELRKFGVVMATAFGIVSGILYWREKEAWCIVTGIAVLFLLFGLIIPKSLKTVEWIWMKFAHYLGIVMTYVLVALTFFIVITPFGFVIRLFSKDLLGLKFKPEAESYWQPVDPDGPTSRPDKPY